MTRTEQQARRERLDEALLDRGLDSLVVTSLPNVRYLSGFTGSNAILLAGGGEPFLFTDPRYEIQAAEQTRCRVAVVGKGPLISTVASALRRRKAVKIGIESMHINQATYARLAEDLNLNAELVAAIGIVERLRAIKSESELERIRASVQLCSKAFEKAMRRLRPGVREFELAAELDHQMRRLGAERPAFDTIVASGPRTALPHAEPTAKALNNNELLLIDMGARHMGYASDMTRVALLGRASRRVRQLHRAVLEAQLAAVDRIRPGLRAGTIDREARRVLKKHGLDGYFVHSTGHGLGLEIHEVPRIGRGEKTRLETGMAITIEPGVYLPGFGGIRIEDTIVVTSNGAEVLTPTSKELLVV